MPKPTIQLGRIGQIATRAHDLDRAVAFYRDVLGLPFLYRFGSLAFFDCDGVRLLIETPPTPDFDHPGSLLYFVSTAIDKDYAQLQQAGVTFVDEPHIVGKLEHTDVWMVFFKDTESNMLALMEERLR